MRIRELFTGKDNHTLDIGRWSWALSFAIVLGCVIWNMAHAATIDPLNVANALSVIAGAHGAALWAKKDTEQ